MVRRQLARVGSSQHSIRGARLLGETVGYWCFVQKCRAEARSAKLSAATVTSLAQRAASRRVHDPARAAMKEALRVATAASKGREDNSGEPLITHTLRVMAMADTDESRTVAALYGAIRAGVPAAEMLRFAPENLVVAAALVAGEPSGVPGGGTVVERIKSNPLAHQVMLWSLNKLVVPERLAGMTDQDRVELIYVSAQLTDRLTRE